MFVHDKSRVQNQSLQQCMEKNIQTVLTKYLVRSELLSCTHLITYLRSLNIINACMHFEALVPNAVYKISWILCYLGFSLLVEEAIF